MGGSGLHSPRDKQPLAAAHTRAGRLSAMAGDAINRTSKRRQSHIENHPGCNPGFEIISRDSNFVKRENRNKMVDVNEVIRKWSA